jgi:hypothetical protein
MTAGLTAALIVAAALGASFRATRHIGVAACAALCFIYPWLAIPLLIVIAGVFVRQTRRRDRRS